MKVKLHRLPKLERCESFINDFIQDKEVIDISITPLRNGEYCTYIISILYNDVS